MLSFCSAAESKAQSMITISIGPLFTVNSPADSVDADVGDGFCEDSNGLCTLRAAIEESNHEPNIDAGITSTNMIIFALPNPSVINLTLGELNITSGLWIFGPGARQLTVQRSTAPGTPNFRVFRVSADRGGVEIRRLNIRNGNAGGGNGGGILVEAGSGLSLTDVAVSANSAVNGGGIANEGTLGGLFANRILVNSNTAGAQGGGIYNQGSFSPRITNSTITNNTAASGGGIYNSGGLWLVNDTISHNTATKAASSIFSTSPSMTVLNTIVGSDAPSAVTALSGSFVTKGNNIITDSRNSTGFTHGQNSDQVSENNLIDPVLGPLADNGGHTDTRALLAGSPAVDAGNNCVMTDSCDPMLRMGMSSDQRVRHYRKVGTAVDAGAFEAGAVPMQGLITFGSAPRPGLPAIFGGTIAILTSVTTGEKFYSAIHPFGSFVFQNIPADFYMIERRGKRMLAASGPIPMGLEEVPIGLEPAAFKAGGDMPGFQFYIETQNPRSAIRDPKL